MQTQEKIRKAVHRLYIEVILFLVTAVALVAIMRVSGLDWLGIVGFPVLLLIFFLIHLVRIEKLRCPHCDDLYLLRDHSLIFLERYRFCESCGKPYHQGEKSKTSTQQQRSRLQKNHSWIQWLLFISLFFWIGVFVAPFLDWLPAIATIIALIGLVLSHSVIAFYAYYVVDCPACHGKTIFGSTVYQPQFLRNRHCQFCGAHLHSPQVFPGEKTL